MQLDKPFNDYSKEEQLQIMFQALKEIKAENEYLHTELESAKNKEGLLTTAQHTYSNWNYALWASIFIAFILGYLMRGF